MDWLIKVVDKVILRDDYDLMCDHCSENSKYCQARFCENIKRQLLIERDNRYGFSQ